MDNPNAPLPKAPILGYLSKVSTPTRVRNVAARSVFWIGMVHFAFFALIFALAVWDVWTTARGYVRWHRMGPGVGPPPGVTLRDYYDALWVRGNYSYLVFLAMIVAPSVLLTVCSGTIRRGRKVPAILTLIYLIVLTIVTLLVSATYISMIFVYGLGAGSRPQPAVLLWLFLAPVAVLIIMLLKDLVAFLYWIARNPTIEKPPTPFLSKPGQLAGDGHG